MWGRTVNCFQESHGDLHDLNMWNLCPPCILFPRNVAPLVSIFPRRTLCTFCSSLFLFAKLENFNSQKHPPPSPLSPYKLDFFSYTNKGCVHCGLAIYIKMYPKEKEELWKLKYFTTHKYTLQKIYCWFI